MGIFDKFFKNKSQHRKKKHRRSFSIKLTHMVANIQTENTEIMQKRDIKRMQSFTDAFS